MKRMNKVRHWTTVIDRLLTLGEYRREWARLREIRDCIQEKQDVTDRDIAEISYLRWGHDSNVERWDDFEI